MIKTIFSKIDEKISFDVKAHVLATVILFILFILGYYGLTLIKKDNTTFSKTKEFSEIILNESFLWAEGRGVDERKSVHEYAVCMSYFSANMLGEKADCLKKVGNKEVSEFVTNLINKSDYGEEVKRQFIQQ